MLTTICGRSTTAGIDTGPTATESSEDATVGALVELRV
jgi:hypothetical protein